MTATSRCHCRRWRRSLHRRRRQATSPKCRRRHIAPAGESMTLRRHRSRGESDPDGQRVHFRRSGVLSDGIWLGTDDLCGETILTSFSDHLLGGDLHFWRVDQDTCSWWNCGTHHLSIWNIFTHFRNRKMDRIIASRISDVVNFDWLLLKSFQIRVFCLECDRSFYLRYAGLHMALFIPVNLLIKC